MSPREVAALMGVRGRCRWNSKTVARWAKAGKLNAIRTLGGHRRYYRADIEALLRPADGEDR